MIADDAVAFSPLAQSGGEDPANFATYLPGFGAIPGSQSPGNALHQHIPSSPGYSPTSPSAPTSPFGPAPTSPYGTSPFATSPYFNRSRNSELLLHTLPPHPSSTLPHLPSSPRHRLSVHPRRTIKCCQANHRMISPGLDIDEDEIVPDLPTLPVHGQ